MFCLKLKLRGCHPKCWRSAQIWQSELKEPANTRYQSENVSLKKCMFFFFTLGMPIRAAPKRHFQEIRGDRTFHSIWSTETSFHLKVQELICYFKFCLYEEYNANSNKDCVSNCEERAIERKPTRAVVAEQQESIKDLACKASAVAIESYDPAGECHLLKVTSDGSDGLFLSSQRSCPGCIHLKWIKRGNRLFCHYLLWLFWLCH